MKIKIHNITQKLINAHTNHKNHFINLPNNGKFLPKFNPSIIHLLNNLYLMSYRIWIDITSEYVYKYPEVYENSSPWISNWSPYLKWFDNDNFVNDENVQLNNFGLAIINIDDNGIKIIYDEIIKVEYHYYFVEDGRLFKDKDGIIRILFSASSFDISKNIFFKNIKNNNSERFMITVEIGSIEKILNEVFCNQGLLLNLFEPDEIIKLIKIDPQFTIKKPNILCPYIHKNIVEKNWSLWTSNDKNYLTYFTIPFGSPLIHINIINFDEVDIWYNENNKNNKNKENLNNSDNSDNYDNYDNFDNSDNIYYNLYYLQNNFKNMSLVDLKNIINEHVNFFENFNFFYYYSIKFSGGSSCIRFNDSENIGIGHVVIDVINVINNVINSDEKISIEYYQKLYNINYELAEKLYYNILNICYRPIGESNDLYQYHHSKYIYMMFFYTFNYEYPFNIKRISFIFSPKFMKFKTGIVFPCGLEIVNEKVLVSYGESDNLVCIFETSKNEVNDILFDINKIHPLEIYFYEFN